MQTVTHHATRDGAEEFITNLAVLRAHGIDPANIEFPELEVPICTGNQRQGDVFLLRVTTNQRKGSKKIGKAGVVVVRAETNSANTHTLHALTGDCFWKANPTADREDELVQGWLTVTNGAEATLIHTEEHNVLGIGAGTFELRRQREFAGEWQRVAD